VDFSVNIEGDDRLSIALSKLETGLGQPRRLYQSLAEFMADRTAARFKQGGLPKRWKDIKKQSRNQRVGSKSTPPLWDTGSLYEEVTATRPGVPHSLFQLTPDGFIQGTDREDAARHQFGFKGRDSKGRKVNEPARVFEVITSDDERGMKPLVEAYIDSLI
jgi:phage gpG-like protein